MVVFSRSKSAFGALFRLRFLQISLCKKAFVLIALLFSTAATAEFDSTDPEALLVQMAAALDQQSYGGTFTYEFGGPLETLVFERRVREQGTRERIRHLSGVTRDFSRQLPKNYCGNAASRLFLAEEASALDKLGEHYAFRYLGSNRIADRHVNLVQVLPKDGARYGFTLGIDKQTHLPLMVTLTGTRGQVLERFQFVQLALGPVLDEQVLASPSQRLPFTQTSCELPQKISGWQPAWLPEGFVAARVIERESQTIISYTDGLASLSVFVMPIRQATGAVGLVQRGATVAAMTMAARGQESFKVSVVGEVPPPIARKVAASVRFITP